MLNDSAEFKPLLTKKSKEGFWLPVVIDNKREVYYSLDNNQELMHQAYYNKNEVLL